MQGSFYKECIHAIEFLLSMIDLAGLRGNNCMNCSSKRKTVGKLQVKQDHNNYDLASFEFFQFFYLTLDKYCQAQNCQIFIKVPFRRSESNKP